MSFFKKLFGALGGGGGAPAGGAGGNAFWLYVRCAVCGEPIRVRVNREHDLSPEYDGDGDMPTAYLTSKEVVGQKCFRRIHVDVTFDRDKRITEQNIKGGSFITEDEYGAETAPPV